MKSAARSIATYALSLFLTSVLFKGLSVTGGLEQYLIGGVVLTAGHYVLKPLLTILTLPLQFLSLGLFSIIIHVAVLFVASTVYPTIQVKSFSFSGLIVFGVQIPAFSANLFLSYVIISVTIYTISKLVRWLMDEE